VLKWTTFILALRCFFPHLIHTNVCDGRSLPPHFRSGFQPNGQGLEEKEKRKVGDRGAQSPKLSRTPRKFQAEVKGQQLHTA